MKSAWFYTNFGSVTFKNEDVKWLLDQGKSGLGNVVHSEGNKLQNMLIDENMDYFQTVIQKMKEHANGVPPVIKANGIVVDE